MGVIDNAREAVKLVQQIDNLDLYRRLLDLQAEVMALVEENAALKKRLQIAEELKFRDNSYWRGDDGPFCARCWDGDAKLVRLFTSTQYRPQCPNCNKVAL